MEKTVGNTWQAFFHMMKNDAFYMPPAVFSPFGSCQVIISEDTVGKDQTQAILKVVNKLSNETDFPF